MSLEFKKVLEENGVEYWKPDNRVVVRNMAAEYTQKSSFGESMTKQSFREESDINYILAKYDATGMIDHINNRRGAFLDVSEVGDYRTALEQVTKANEFFMGLPAAVRAKFENDPALFLDRASGLTDDELVALGLKALEKPKGRPVGAGPDGGEKPPAQ